MKRERGFWRVALAGALVAAAGYYWYIGAPSYRECRASGHTMRYCLVFLIR